ncbi:MAG: hypothetical protein HZA23_08555 [Nitrospirae bacterium]|nr:hypothetical protein [Nitrospirota bacterium]
MANNEEEIRYLRLLVSHPIGPVELQVGDSLPILAILEAQDLPSCEVSITYDRAYVELIIGPSSVHLEEGTYREELAWTFRALAPTAMSLPISMTARAGPFLKQAMVPVSVSSTERTE